jgi:hypothetical protein
MDRLASRSPRKKKNARELLETGEDARLKGGRRRRDSEITLAWVRVWSARKESLMERTTSSGVDGRSRDAMRKKKDISALAVRLPFPCRVAGRLMADRGRGVIMHTGVDDGTGRARAVAIATPSLCLLCIWPLAGCA